MRSSGFGFAAPYQAFTAAIRHHEMCAACAANTHKDLSVIEHPVGGT